MGDEEQSQQLLVDRKKDATVIKGLERTLGKDMRTKAEAMVGRQLVALG